MNANRPELVEYDLSRVSIHVRSTRDILIDQMKEIRKMSIDTPATYAEMAVVSVNCLLIVTYPAAFNSSEPAQFWLTGFLVSLSGNLPSLELSLSVEPLMVGRLSRP